MASYRESLFIIILFSLASKKFNEFFNSAKYKNKKKPKQQIDYKHFLKQILYKSGYFLNCIYVTLDFQNKIAIIYYTDMIEIIKQQLYSANIVHIDIRYYH